MGSLAPHKFVKLTEVNPDFAELPNSDISEDPFNYMLEVYMDDCIVLSVSRSRDQLHHVANAIMTGIHDVFSLVKYDTLGGVIDQIGHFLLRLIRAFSEAPECAKIFQENGISRMVFGDYIVNREKNGIPVMSCHIIQACP